MEYNHSFPGMREDETVCLWVHKHWIAHLKTFFSIFIFGAIFTWLIGLLVTGFLGENASAPYLYLLLILYILSVWLWGYIRFIDDEFDCLILTSDRVIDVTQIGLTKITFSETSLDLIQDVRDTNNGFIGNILDYGDVEAQTAGRSIVFQIDNVPHPNKIAKVVQDTKKDFLIRTGRRKEAGSGIERDTLAVK